jgi:hypothetical protein
MALDAAAEIVGKVTERYLAVERLPPVPGP